MLFLFFFILFIFLFLKMLPTWTQLLCYFFPKAILIVNYKCFLMFLKKLKLLVFDPPNYSNNVL